MYRTAVVLGYGILLVAMIAIMAALTLSTGMSGTISSPLQKFAQQIETSIMGSPKQLSFFISGILTYLAIWLTICFQLRKSAPDWERKWTKVFIVGCSLMLIFCLIPLIIGILAKFSTGFIQEVAQRMAGTLASPVFMEGSLIFIALTILLCYNGYRRSKNGDEYVEIETEE